MGADVAVGGATQAELHAIQALFTSWNDTFSRFRPDSELSRVNGSRAEALAVSPLFARVLGIALDAAEATGGLVDPTLGVAIEAAGYDRDFDALGVDRRPPGAAAPGRLSDIRLDGCLLFRPAGLRLDLNGVVKSLAADEALALLPGEGWVAAGGDVAARGPVVVALPAGDCVRIRGGGIATSGTARRRWTRGGAARHHLIDPATGLPSTARWVEVTVAAGSCLAADVAAKAAFLLGAAGPSWLAARGLPGRFCDEQGCLIETPAWRDPVSGEERAA